VKAFVEFRSSKFPPYDGEEEQINPGLWGKRLADLVAKLAEDGLAAAEPIAEDWGLVYPDQSRRHRAVDAAGRRCGDNTVRRSGYQGRRVAHALIHEGAER
jgi:hypothetical protein